MYPHRIRLRGPWEGTPTEEITRRVTVPCCLTDLGWANVPVLLTRKFGFPGQIDEHERVWLTLAEVEGLAAFTFNDSLLGEVRNGPFERDITNLLGARNQLKIAVQGSRVGEVAMEVRASAFLQGVEAHRAQGRVYVAGQVKGTCERPLELYVQIDGRNVGYRTINAGEAFMAVLDDAGSTVRVELVHISTVWYTVEINV